MIRRVYLLFFIVSLSCSLAHISAQNEYVPEILTPDVYSLKVAAAISENLAHGKVSISIPIQILNLRSYSLPISINYNMSSIQPNVEPGELGLNWYLSAGGAITRKVQSKIDSESGGFFETLDKFDDLADFEDYKYANEFYKLEEYDKQSDIYTYNFNGHSGEFVIGKDGFFHAVPDQNMKIALSEGNVYFYLTTDDGAIYTFQTLEPLANPNKWHLIKIVSPQKEEITFSYEEFKTITWYSDIYAKSVFSSDLLTNNTFNISAATTKSTCFYDYYLLPGQNFDIEVNKGYFNDPNNSINLSSVEPYIQGIQFAGHVMTEINTRWGDYNFNPYPLVPNLNEFAITNMYYLTSIHTDEWKIEFDREISAALDIFNLSTGDEFKDRKLKGINIYKGNELIRFFDFYYIENSTERLKLYSISEKTIVAGAIEENPPYVFNYYNPNGLINLPSSYTHKVDHWGFYNGVHNEDEYYLPQKNTDFLSREAAGYLQKIGYFTQSECDDILLEGMLKSIEFPTGGIKEYIYEPHDFSLAQFNGTLYEYNNEPCGGVRIKQILTKENENTINDVEFFYQNNYITASGLVNTVQESSGILSTIPEYTKYQVDKLGPTVFVSKGSSFDFYGSSKGGHIQYSEVAKVENNEQVSIFKYTDRISNPDELGSTNTILEFYGGYHDDIEPFRHNFSTVNTITSLELERGKLSDEILYEYNINDGKYYIIKHKNIVYAPGDEYDRKHSEGLYVFGQEASPYTPSNLYIIGPQYFHYYSYLPQEEIVYNYSDLEINCLTQTNEFYYNHYDQIFEVLTTNSDQTSTSKYYLHPTDYLNGGWEDDMKSDHFYNYIIEELTIDNNSNRIIDGKIRKYSSMQNDGIVLDKVYSADISIPANQFQFSNMNSSGIIPDVLDHTNISSYRLPSTYFSEPDIYISNHTEIGHISEIQYRHGTTVSYLWGYENMQDFHYFYNADDMGNWQEAITNNTYLLDFPSSVKCYSAPYSQLLTPSNQGDGSCIFLTSTLGHPKNFSKNFHRTICL
jgi:hypothetical protein